MDQGQKKKYPHKMRTRTAIGLALEARKYAVEPIKGTAGARLNLTKDGKRTLALVRTSADRWLGWMRDEKGKFKGLEDADHVVVGALDDEDHPSWIDIYAFSPNDVGKSLVANATARKAATPALSDTAPLWVCLDESKRGSGWGVGSNLKSKAHWHVRVPYGSGPGDAPSPSPGISPSPAGETKESFAARVRQEFADLIGVSVDKVTVDFRVTL